MRIPYKFHVDRSCSSSDISDTDTDTFLKFFLAESKLNSSFFERLQYLSTLKSKTMSVLQCDAMVIIITEVGSEV